MIVENAKGLLFQVVRESEQPGYWVGRWAICVARPSYSLAADGGIAVAPVAYEVFGQHEVLVPKANAKIRKQEAA